MAAKTHIFVKEKYNHLSHLNSKLEQVHQFLGDKYKEIGKEQISIFRIHSAEKISGEKIKTVVAINCYYRKNLLNVR